MKAWGRVPVVIFAVMGGFFFGFIHVDSGADPRPPSSPPVAGKTDSPGEAIRMTEIAAKIEKGKISIPLKSVQEKKIVRFEYEGNGARIPLLSYVTPTGKVVTAVSVCEPCRSTRFHIRGKSIVCNACSAEWDLETLKGIRGGCLNYPPDAIPNKVEKDQIVIDEKTVAQWKPRV
ncbi:MAG: DUF2318 domain-containing protein [Deltaproteobacteria bacterium]|nr:MAG: DUF2318 domain-containing protein [Deltaproteobacteria bacterium]